LFERYSYYEVNNTVNKTVLRKATDAAQVYIFNGKDFEKIDKTEWSKLKMSYISDDGAKKIIKEAKQIFKTTGNLDIQLVA